MAARSHYDVLGVQPTADETDIRRAYLDLARRHHPDRTAIGNGGAVDPGTKMRQVNEAWRILGAPVRRRRYDLELAALLDQRRTQTPPRSAPAPPRAEYIPTAPSGSEAGSRLMGLVPWVLAVAVLGGIFVFTAYASGSGAGQPTRPTSGVPVPEVVDELAPGTCIRLTSGGSFLVMDCDQPNDGQIAAMAPLGGPCPAGTQLLDLPAADVAACVT
ncbi:MAG: J domain-containing protein [Actinomycetia bacterium]|nr:J domain-containing protein [Actinomycetes bacterium]